MGKGGKWVGNELAGKRVEGEEEKKVNGVTIRRKMEVEGGNRG